MSDHELELARADAAGLLRREYAAGELVVRAGDGPGSERIIEGIVIPYGQVATVRDSPGGRSYRETIARGAAAGLDPATVQLEYVDTPQGDYNHHNGARLIGRGIAAEDRPGGLWMGFRVSRTRAGDDGLELARDGVLAELSPVFRPIADRSRRDGVLERTSIDVRRVAIVARGAYHGGATVTAVRAGLEGQDVNCEHCGGELIPGVAHVCPTAAARRARSRAGDASSRSTGSTAAAGDAGETETDGDDDEGEETPPANGRRNRTRVTVDVERAAAERATTALLARGGNDRPQRPAIVTRAEMVYRADATWSGRDDRGRRYSLLSDGWRARQGDTEAAERLMRFERAREEFERGLEDAAMPLLSRAGEVLSTEIPGAYPNDYIPGLLTPRILKGRPMGGFYQVFPIADGLPKIFPKVTTSTTVAVQSAEGANPAASDFGTTAVTATPLLYGAETVVSRQVLDGSSPAAEAMILEDMVEAYAQASETVIKTAVEAGAVASTVAITAATPYAGTLANVINYYAIRFKSATGAFIPSALFPVLAAQGDTTGRPFLPMIGAQNSDGQTLTDDLSLELAVLTARGKLSYASTVNVCVFGRPNDYVIFESPTARFSYDAVTGPSGVRVGIWAYLVVGARLGSLSRTAA